MAWVLSAIAGFGFVTVTFAIAYMFAPKGWRTTVFNAVTGAGTVAVPVTDHLAKVPWATVVDEKTAFVVVQGCLVANVIWRAKTTTPMGKTSGDAGQEG